MKTLRARLMLNKNSLLIFLGLCFFITVYFLCKPLFSLFHFSNNDIGIVSTVVVPDGQNGVLFVGDVLLARNVEFLMKKNGSNYPYMGVSEIFADAAIVIGNFESSMSTPHLMTPSFVTTFSVSADYLDELSAAGFTHLSLANNHAYDYGKPGFETTKKSLENAGLVTFGQPDNLAETATTIIKNGENKIGILAVHDIDGSFGMASLLPEINRLKKLSDYQILYIHFGQEYKLYHSKSQEKIAHDMIDAGIDAVIGHHPHVVQDIEVYKNKPIFYSLGNFIFDQYFSVDVGQGLALRLKVSAEAAEFDLLPITNDGTPSQPHMMDQGQRRLFLANLARLSTESYREYIKSGKLIFKHELATSTQTSIITP